MAELLRVPKLQSALDDIRAIAQGMAVLPELARILASIEGRVQRLDDEVMKMRQAVESMGGDVGTLPARLDDLQDSIPLRRRRNRS